MLYRIITFERAIVKSEYLIEADGPEPARASLTGDDPPEALAETIHEMLGDEYVESITAVSPDVTSCTCMGEHDAGCAFARYDNGPEPPEWITREGYDAIVQDGQGNDLDAGGDGSREYVESYLSQQYRIIGEDKEGE